MGTSSTRSRNGGSVIGKTLSRKYRSSRRWRLRIASPGSRFVAEMKRTSTTASCCSLPTRRTTPSCTTRKQLRLQRQRHLGQLVEEERAAVRHLEQSDLVAIGARERALAVAEHLGLEELFRQRRAVERHEGLRRAAAVPVHELRDHFLARSAFADDA